VHKNRINVKIDTIFLVKEIAGNCWNS